MKREKLFFLLQTILWVSAILALIGIGVTAYFFITKYPVPYLDTSTACSMAGANTSLAGCSDPQGPFKQIIYNGSKISLGIATIATVISSIILVVNSTPRDRATKNRATRNRNRAAMTSAIAAVVANLIIVAIFEYVAKRF